LSRLDHFRNQALGVLLHDIKFFNGSLGFPCIVKKCGCGKRNLEACRYGDSHVIFSRSGTLFSMSKQLERTISVCMKRARIALRNNTIVKRIEDVMGSGEAKKDVKFVSTFISQRPPIIYYILDVVKIVRVSHHRSVRWFG
jgi:hypothetical protein